MRNKLRGSPPLTSVRHSGRALKRVGKVEHYRPPGLPRPRRLRWLCPGVWRRPEGLVQQNQPGHLLLHATGRRAAAAGQSATRREAAGGMSAGVGTASGSLACGGERRWLRACSTRRRRPRNRLTRPRNRLIRPASATDGARSGGGSGGGGRGSGSGRS
eukprot:scaffold11901_cov96-Isochrysis_galbana.AAC.7